MAWQKAQKRRDITLIGFNGIRCKAPLIAKVCDPMLEEGGGVHACD